MAFNTGNPVPSTDARDLSDNAESIDQITNGTSTVTTRTGKVIKSIGPLVDTVDAAATQGLIDIAADVSNVDATATQAEIDILTRLNEVGVIYDSPIRPWSASLLVEDLRAHEYNGDIYIPTKALPFTTGATFNTDDWMLLQGITNGDIDNDISIVKVHPNVAAFKADATEYPDGKIIHLNDRGADFVKITGTGTGNDGNIIASANTNQSASLIEKSFISLKMFGGDTTLAKQYALDNNVPLLISPNEFINGKAENTLIRNLTSSTATRVHIEPNGEVAGTKAKFDLMFDPFQDNQVDYRIQSMYTEDDPNEQGNGVAVFNASSNGTNFGIWPLMNFGFSENNATGIPMKLAYFDTSDTEWRAPYKSGWRTGNTYTIDDYITSSNNLYKATTTGTSGATKPSHASGTASDGGVNWVFIRDYAAASGTGSIKPCAIFGDRDDMPLHGFKDARAQFSKDSVYHTGTKQIFTDNTGAEIWQISNDSNDDNLHIRSAGGGAVRYDNSGQFVQHLGLARLYPATTVSASETVVPLTGEVTINFVNPSPTSVVDFSNGLGFQRFTVSTDNGNTTLVHGTNIKLKGGVNKLLDVDEILMFQMSSTGGIAKQIVS